MVPVDAGVSSLRAVSERDSRGGCSTVSLALTPFDQRHYLELIRARGDTIRRVVAQLKPEMELANALDAGCGVGFFAQTLGECGLYVRGFDGRLENVAEARRRFPRIPFGQGDVEIRILRGWERSTWCCALGWCTTWRIRCWPSGICAL